MLSDDLNALFDLVVEVPDSTDAFAAVRRYMHTAAQFLDFPATQAATRLAARLRSTTDPVRQAELQYEIELVNRDGVTLVPRLVWGSTLVAIYATFETGVRSILTHWAENVPGAPPFDTRSSVSFLKRAKQYAMDQIGAPLFTHPDLETIIRELKAFRDSFAHSTGRIPPRRTELHSCIDKMQKRGHTLAVEDDAWIGTPILANFYLRYAEHAYRLFANAVMEKYVARKLPSSAA